MHNAIIAERQLIDQKRISYLQVYLQYIYYLQYSWVKLLNGFDMFLVKKNKVSNPGHYTRHEIE